VLSFEGWCNQATPPSVLPCPWYFKGKAGHEAKAKGLAAIVAAFILAVVDPYEGGDKANGKKESC